MPINFIGNARVYVDQLRTDLSQSGSMQGGEIVAYKAPYPLSIQRTDSDKHSDIISVFDFMTAAEIASVKAYDFLLDVTVPFQNAIDAAYGKTLIAPRGGYRASNLVIYPVTGQPVSPFANLPITIIGEGYDGNGGNGGTFILIESDHDGFIIHNNTIYNADAPILIQGIGLIGDATNNAGGCGITAKKINNMQLRNIYAYGMRDTGVLFDRCYGSSVRDSVLLRNRRFGFHADKAFNIGELENIKAYSNGRIYSEEVGNIYLSGSGNRNISVMLKNVDVSYAGADGFVSFKRSNASLTEIVVLGGTATATTPADHTLSNGDKISVRGATVDPALNTKYAATITVIDEFTFTFPTIASDGTYNEATLSILPPSTGLIVSDTIGLKAEIYAEDCAQDGAYIGDGVSSFEFSGGYFQNCKLFIDSLAEKGDVGGMVCTGSQGGINHTATSQKYVNIRKTSITLESGAAIELSDHYMIDGIAEGIWTPAWTNLTVVLGAGAISHSGRYQEIGDMRKFTAVIHSTGGATTASVNGVTFINNLPYPQAGDGASLDICSAAYGSTGEGIGLGTVTAGNAYPPTWPASSATYIVVSGLYRSA